MHVSVGCKFTDSLKIKCAHPNEIFLLGRSGSLTVELGCPATGAAAGSAPFAVHTVARVVLHVLRVLCMLCVLCVLLCAVDLLHWVRAWPGSG